jgi:pyruvate decarboxylase
MKALLPELAQRLKVFREKASQLKVPEFRNKKVVDTKALITHDWFWPRVAGWFQERDLIVTEAGTLQRVSCSLIC